MRAPAGQLSLTGRALRLLARREHSAAELRRKLARHAADGDELERVIADLTRRGWFSQQRFIEQFGRSRAPKLGVARIAQELREHEVDDNSSRELLATLRGSERERALALWQRRFGVAPADAAERARQDRFLAQRGFSSDAIRWVMRHAVEA